jgi:sugar phosphate isomerase/epimerase
MTDVNRLDRNEFMIRTLLLLFSLMTSSFVQAGEFAPALYPFQNGMRFTNAEEGVRLIKELGYQGIGSINPEDLAKVKAACEKDGLNIFSIYTGGKVNADGFDYAKNVSEAIAMLKGTNALVELNVQRGTNPNDTQAIAFVKEIAEQAKAAGLKVVLYPHDKFHIERIDHALRIAKATGCDNVGVAFNLCHFLKCQPGDDPEATLTAAKPLLWSVSICGADADGKDWNTLIRPLDEGTFDQANLLRHLNKLSYKGPIGLQCFNIKVDPKQNLTRSWEAWKKHLAASQEK